MEAFHKTRQFPTKQMCCGPFVHSGADVEFEHLYRESISGFQNVKQSVHGHSAHVD